MIKEIEEMIQRATKAVYTLSLGIIEEADYTTLKCKIKPKAKIKDAEGNYIEIPSLEEVPLLCLKGGDNVIIAAPKKGDVVLLLHQYFPIELKDNKPYEVPYERRQAFSDAIAIPAVFVASDSIPEIAEDETLIYHKSKNYAKFDKDGNLKISDEGKTNQVEIKFGEGKINIKSTTEVNIQEGTKGAARKDDTVAAVGTGNLGLPIAVAGTITKASGKVKIGD